MRLFIAIDLDNEEYFKDIQKQIDTENAKINLTKAYHLTLKFLGEVSAAKVQKIKEALNKINLESFKIKTTKIGVFPNANFVRVIWIGMEPENEIIELKNKVDDCLSDLFRKEKDFKPHLTLARVKFVKDKGKFIENLRKIKIEEKEFEIKNIKLIRSTLTPDGPVYEDLLVIPKAF